MSTKQENKKSTEPENNGIIRDEKGRVVAGSKSLNPGGRPAIAKYINEKTDGLKTVVDKVLYIFNNSKDKKQVQWAIDYLTDRSAGKPSQHQQVEDVTPEPIQYVSDKKEDEKITP